MLFFFLLLFFFVPCLFLLFLLSLRFASLPLAGSASLYAA